MNWHTQTAFFRDGNLLRWIVNLSLLAATISGIAHAQGAWQIDPKSSVATLSLGSGAETLQVGLSRVSGKVVFEASDPSDPTVTFNINSNEQAADYASMSFSSRRCATSADGKLRVIGDLSVTRVERSVTIDANEGYAGPQYGEPVSHTETHQITLVFSDPRRGASGDGTMHVSGASTVVREEFPQLVDAVTTGNWPSQVINDEKCAGPSTIGEDYHGAECTGTVIARIDNPVLSTGAPSGEGFYGFVPTISPDRDKATIALQLTLTQVSTSDIASNWSYSLRSEGTFLYGPNVW
jgi:hypothetical protein